MYNRCSNKQLKIIPATGTGVQNGVYTVPAPQGVCNGMTYEEVSNYAKNLIRNADIDKTNVMMVMPNCVLFGAGVAWGEVGGFYTWFRAENYNFPMTQGMFKLLLVRSIIV